MKTPTNPFRLFLRALSLSGVFLLLARVDTAYAGSATWNLDPTSNDWNTATNWTPNTVPNGPNDVATFATSSQREVGITSAIEVDSIVFEQGASSFTLVKGPGELEDYLLTVSGAGIVNNSGAMQNFVLTNHSGAYTAIKFYNYASAGILASYHLQATNAAGYNVPCYIEFYGSSSAGSASFVNDGGGNTSDGGAATSFAENATAASATITLNGATHSDAAGGHSVFSDYSTADHATLTANATIGANGGGGTIYFLGAATAANATLIAYGTTTAKSAQAAGADQRAGHIFFGDVSDGGTALVELFGNSFLDISGRTKPGMSIGSIEGDGIVYLGRKQLSVGTNNLSTRFSGVLRDRGSAGGTGGQLEKVGTGTLTLNGTSLYTGGTTVSEGFLRVDNLAGSATGPGTVQVNAGTLGGAGIMAGPVTVGSGTGPGAFIAPGSGASTLTTQSQLTFKSDGTYVWRVRTTNAKADKLVANGVTIESGAQITGVGRGTLTTGTVLTAISNTSANSLSGTFANLPDGGTLTIGSNTLQANYEGGDGNDLTLTVVP